MKQAPSKLLVCPYLQSKSKASRDTTAKKMNDQVENLGSVQTQ